jgi:hypothetical protein
MRNLLHPILYGTVLAAGAIILLGCATGRTDLSCEGLVSVETVPSEKVDVLSACVWQTEDEVLVYGTLRRRVYSTRPLAVHVHAIVQGPDGAVLEETCTPDVYVPQRRQGRHIRWSRFRAPLAAVPPQGSTVILSPHKAHPAQSDTGSRSTACRHTGSALVYTSFVSCGLECSNSL